MENVTNTASQLTILALNRCRTENKHQFYLTQQQFDFLNQYMKSVLTPKKSKCLYLLALTVLRNRPTLKENVLHAIVVLSHLAILKMN